MRQAFLNTVDRVNAVLLPALVILFALVSCVTMAQVVFRYVFHAPLIWSEELVRYGIICLVFLGAGLVVRRNAMIGVEIVMLMLPPRLRGVMRVFSLLLATAFWALLAWLGIRIQADLEGIRAGVLEIQIRYLYLMMPLGCTWAFINTAASIIDPRGEQEAQLL